MNACVCDPYTEASTVQNSKQTKNTAPASHSIRVYEEEEENNSIVENFVLAVLKHKTKHSTHSTLHTRPTER